MPTTVLTTRVTRQRGAGLWGAAALIIGLAGCATTSGTQAAMPNLPPAPAGTLTVGMTANTNGAQAQGQALADFVKQATGQPTRPAVYPDYDSLAAAVAKGDVDVALMSPMAYVRGSALGQITPLVKMVRNGQSTYHAVLFDKADSPIKNLEDLSKARGLKVAWVDSSSATGYIFPKAFLLSSNIDPQGIFVDQDFKGSHDAVCQAVANGKADIGATFTDDPNGGPITHATGCNGLGEKISGIKVIAVTNDIPTDVVATRPGFPADVQQKITKEAQALAGSDSGKGILRSAFNAEGIAPATDDDYAAVRKQLETFRQ
jgi:phosphonate transport system substrate-binding protein